jgi:hypothetical protein
MVGGGWILLQVWSSRGSRYAKRFWRGGAVMYVHADVDQMRGRQPTTFQVACRCRAPAGGDIAAFCYARRSRPEHPGQQRSLVGSRAVFVNAARGDDFHNATQFGSRTDFKDLCIFEVERRVSW